MSIRVGYTGWTWIQDEFDGWKPFSNKYDEMYEQYIKDIADLGYQTAENFEFISKLYENRTDWFNDLHNKYNVKFENLYFYYTNDPKADIEKARDCIKFMIAVNAHYMNMQGVLWRDEPFVRPINKEALDIYAEEANTIGRMCYEAGIKACMHPHANTPLFNADQIDYFFENTDPKYVHMCMDTAHTTLAGIDPVKQAKKYADRMGYMHLKDLDPDASLNPEWPMKRFRPLGYGCIDFKGVVNELKKAGYDDILCVELDYQPVCNYRSAQISRDYIHNVLRLL